jgi:hypothetical protein
MKAVISSQSVIDSIAIQQARYSRESERYLANQSASRLSIRQTQILMNKYSTDKAMYIASRFNSIKGVK